MNRHLYISCSSQDNSIQPQSFNQKHKPSSHYQETSKRAQSGQKEEQSCSTKQARLIVLAQLLREQNKILIQSLQDNKIPIDPKVITRQRHILNICQQIKFKLSHSNLSAGTPILNQLTKQSQSEIVNTTDKKQNQIEEIQKRKTFLEVATGQLQKSRSRSKNSVLKQSNGFLSKSKQKKDVQPANVQFQRQNLVHEFQHSNEQILIEGLKNDQIIDKNKINIRYSCNNAQKQNRSKKYKLIANENTKMYLDKNKKKMQRLKDGVLRMSARVDQINRNCSPRMSNNMYQ